jgi:hypothetical protein
MKLFVVIVIILCTCLVLGRLLIRRITRGFNDRSGPYKKLSLKDFNQATTHQKIRLFNEWCKRKGFQPQEIKTEMQLFDYVTDYKLPTLYDWKEIHGLQATQQVGDKVYNDWLNYIGASGAAKHK